MTKIIAELSSNHGGDLCRCLDMIAAAKKAGCWAAKFQLYRPEDLPDFDSKSNIIVPKSWIPHLLAKGDHLNMVVFASVFAPWAVDVLGQYGCIYFKVASPESTRLADYRKLANQLHAWSENIFVSSGRADWEAMREIFPIARALYCKAGYPATLDIDDVQFMAKNAMGFSDHTAGILGSLAMAAAGAQYIEKHFKLDDNCVDAAFSLNPDQMKVLCDLAS